MTKIQNLINKPTNPNKNTESRMDVWAHLGPNDKACSGKGDYPDKYIATGRATIRRFLEKNNGAGGSPGRIESGDCCEN